MSSHTLDQVSVIIRVHNRTEFVCQAIHSLLRQNHQNIEILVVDDGSDMPIENYIKSHCSSTKIRFIRKPHTGRSDSSNVGIANAQGNYLIFLDDDDLLHPQMISMTLTVLKNFNADIVHVGYRYFFGTEQNLDSQKFNICKDFSSPLKLLTTRNPFPINTVLVKKKIIENAGNFDKNMDTAEDWDLWLRVVARGVKIKILDQCLAFIRVHKNNVSQNTFLMSEGSLKVLENAEKYLNQNQRKGLNLKWKIAFRRLVVGWNVTLLGSSQKGRQMFLSVLKKDSLLLPLSSFLWFISFLPVYYLKRLTNVYRLITHQPEIYRNP